PARLAVPARGLRRGAAYGRRGHLVAVESAQQIREWHLHDLGGAARSDEQRGSADDDEKGENGGGNRATGPLACKHEDAPVDGSSACRRTLQALSRRSVRLQPDGLVMNCRRNFRG